MGWVVGLYKNILDFPRPFFPQIGRLSKIRRGAAQNNVAYVGSSSNGALTGTAVTCPQPAGIQTGDALVAVFNNNNLVYETDNNGGTPWTKIYPSGTGRSYNAGSANYSVWTRVAGASEPATFAWTASASDRWEVIVSAYRTVHASIFDVAPSDASENLRGDVPFATLPITTLTSGAMIIAFALGDGAALVWSSTPADSFNSRQNLTGSELAALADKSMPVAGLQAPVSWGSVNMTGLAVIQVFALRPK